MNIVPFGGNLVWPVLIVSVLFGILIWGVVYNNRLSAVKKWTLFSLRAFVILLLFWILLRPTAVTTQTQRDNSSVAILLDSSRSMGIGDIQPGEIQPGIIQPNNIQPGNQNRFSAALQTLGSSSAAIEKMKSELDLKWFTFDSVLVPVKEESILSADTAVALAPKGEMTALGKCLDELLRLQAGKRLLGVVLLSDGAQRLPIQKELSDWAILPQQSAQSFNRLGVPLYMLCFGQPEGQSQTRDIAVVDFTAPPRVFLQSAARIEAQIRVEGITGVDIPVHLLFETSPGKMEIVDKTTVRAEISGQVIPVEFTYQPKAVGEYKLTLDVPILDKEEKSDNNSMDAFIRVIDSGLKILYLEGTIRPEQKFISRVFEDSPYAQLEVMRLDRRAGIDQQAILNALDSGQYNVIILGDVHSSLLGEDIQNKIVDLVKSGTGLFLLGGFNAYGPGGYAQSPLNAVIPIVMDRLERQNPDEAPAADLHIDRPIRLRPTLQGKQKAVLQISDSNPNEIWRKLPALDGANKWQAVKPGAEILAQTDDKQQQPLLAATQVGKGLVLAFAADSTWQWVMAGFGPEHQRFWLQSIFYLAQKEQKEDNRVTFSVDKRRVPCGGKIEFSATAILSDRKKKSSKSDTESVQNPLDPSCFRVEIKTPEDKIVSVSMKKNDENYSAVFDQTDLPGDYQYTLSAIVDGELLGKIQGRFQTFKQDVELDDPASDPGLMKQLAAITRGQFITSAELSDVLNRLTEQAKTLEIKREILHSLWDSAWILLSILLLLSTEWTLRKMWTNV